MRARQQLLRATTRRAWSVRALAGAGALVGALSGARVSLADDTPARDKATRVIEKIDALRGTQATLPALHQGTPLVHGAWELRNVADRHLRRKDYAQAERVLLDARARYPTALTLLKDLAVVRAAAGDTDGAVAYYLEYLRAEPHDDAARLAMARTLSWSKEERHLSEAERILSEYLKDHPESEEALLQRARTQAWRGRAAEAERDYRAFLLVHPQRHDVELELARALSASKDPAFLGRAIAIYDSALARTDDLDLRLARARLYSWTGRIDMAKVDYDVYIAARPDEWSVRLELGRALSWSTSPSDRLRAVEVLSEYLRLVPDDMDALRARSRAREWSSDLEGAIADLRAYVSARTDDEAETNLTRLLAQSPNAAHRAEAVDRLRRYLAAHPTDEAARLELAWILIDSQRPTDRDEGIAILRPYLHAHSHDDRARLALARATAAQNRPASLREALTYYDAYVAAHPDDYAQRLQRGRTRGWSGDFAGATSDLRAYVEHAPHDDGVRLETARLIAQGARPDAAIPWFDDYLSRHPRDFSAQMSKARTLRWARMYSAAETVLRGLLREPRTAAERDEVTLELARLYQETGRSHASLELVRRVLKESPRNAEAAEMARMTYASLTTTTVATQALLYVDQQLNHVEALTASARVPIHPSFGFVANTGIYNLGYRVPSPSPRNLVAGRGDVGVFARVFDVTLQAAGGPRVYEHASAAMSGSVEMQVSPTWWSVARAEYHYDDIYTDLLAPASVETLIRGHALHVTGSAQFPWKGLRAVASAGGRSLNTGNSSFDMGGTMTIPVWRFLSAGYSGQYLTWRTTSLAHWSPQMFMAHLGVVRANQAFAKGAFEYEAQAQIGVASERSGNQSGVGLSLGASGSLVYRPHRNVDLLATLQYGQTIRNVPDPTRSRMMTTDFWWLLPTATVRMRF